jgi:large conductance mechanosensitive channel
VLKEFKAFAMRGNVVDLAVGFILGGAFTTIVQSLVNDIIMPPLGLLLNRVDFTELYIALDGVDYESREAATEAGAAALNYGLFINNVIAFLIMAFALFFVVRTMNRMSQAKRGEAKDAPPPVKPRQEELLEEIRDVLKRERAGA